MNSNQPQISSRAWVPETLWLFRIIIEIHMPVHWPDIKPYVKSYS